MRIFVNTDDNVCNRGSLMFASFSICFRLSIQILIIDADIEAVPKFCQEDS